MARDEKKELVDFLESRAFRPVLDRRPDDYPSESDRQKLRDVQGATRRDLDRYREDYGSAREVIDNYKADLTSSAGRKVRSELHELRLPTLDDVQEDFREKVEDLGLKY